MSRALLFFFVSAAIASAAILAGCSSSTAPNSNGTVGGSLFVPDTVNFGALANGQMKDTTIAISNSGSDTVTITRNALSSSQAKDTNFSHPVSIAPHGYIIIHVEFTPSASGLNAALDSIHYHTGGNSYVVVMLLEANGGGSTGGGGHLVSSNPINFGTLPIGQWKDTTVLLVNNGTASLTITFNTLSGAEGQDTNFSQPVTISAGSYQMIHLQFNPAQAGARSVTDQINYTTGAIQASLTITMLAQGNSAAGGGNTPGPGSTFTYTYTSVDTNGNTSPSSDSTYTVVSNTLTFQGKTNVIQVRDASGGMSYYHLEPNGDISVYINLGNLAGFVNVNSNWFTIPIGSKIEQTSTLFDSTIQYPYSGTTIPVAVSVTSDALDLGPATIKAAGHTFACEKGSLAVTFSASAFGGFVSLASTVQTATIWYSKQLEYYPERQDQTVNSGVLQSNTKTSDTYLLQSYTLK